MGFIQNLRTNNGTPQVTDGVELASPAQAPVSTVHKKEDDIDIQAHGDADDMEGQKPVYVPDSSGVARIEAIQAVWGKYGKKIIIAGIGFMMIMYEYVKISSRCF